MDRYQPPGRSQRDERLQELSQRKTAVAEQREKLADEIDEIDINPQTDIVERYVDGEVQVELSDSAKRRRVAAKISKSAPVDRVDPSEVRLTNSGYELAPQAQRRVDRARVQQLRSELPNSNSIFVPPEGEGFEARNLVSSIAYSLRTPDDLNDAGAVASAAGVGLNDLKDPVSVIQKLDPEEAAGPLPFVDDPETIRTAQEQIAERKQEFQEDPALLGAEIFETDDSLRDFYTFANLGERSFDQRMARIRGAYRIANEREDEIAERIASNNELLKPSDIEVTVDQRNFAPAIDINQDAVEQRQRQQLRTEAAEEAGVEQSLIDISRSNDRLEASIDRDAQKQQFRRETAAEYGVDLSDVSVELTGDELRAEIRRDRGRRQQADEQRQIELPGDDEPLVETNDFGRVSVSPGLDDPLFGSQEQPQRTYGDTVDALQGPLDDASDWLAPKLEDAGGAAGSALSTLSPLTAVEEAALGTNRLEGAYEGFGEEAAKAADIPGAASGALGLSEFAIEGPDVGTRREVATAAAGEAVSDYSDAFQESPVETTARTAGALAGGFGVGAAATRGGTALRSARRAIDMDFEDFVRSNRAQADLTGRDRRTDTVEIEDTDRFSPIPDDAAEQRTLSRDNPRLSASEAGSRRVVDEQIEAGRRQQAPDPSDRPSPSRPRRDTFSAAPDADEIRTVSREPRTGPSSNNQVRERFQWESLKAAQMDTPDADFRAVDRAGRVPEDDLRAVADMDRSVPSDVEIDRGGVVGASLETVSNADVGEVTGSPTLTGDQSPETAQTLFEIGQADRPAGAAVDGDTRVDTRSQTAADTDLRAASLGLLGLGEQGGVASDLGVGTVVRSGVGSQPRSQTASDLVTDIGLDLGSANRVATDAAATGAASASERSTGATANVARATRTTTATTATRSPPSNQPRVPDVPEPDDSDDSRGLLDFGRRQSQSNASSRGPAVGWFGETFDAFATGAFGDRRLPVQAGDAPGGLGLELPTATIADPSEEQQDAIDATAGLFGLDLGGDDDDSDKEQADTGFLLF